MVLWAWNKSPWTRTGLISKPPRSLGTTDSTHCFPKSSISLSTPFLFLSSFRIACNRCFAKNSAQVGSQLLGIWVEPQQVVTWKPNLPVGDNEECSLANSAAWSLGFVEEDKLWKLQRKKYPFDEESFPCATAVGQRPGTASEIARRDSCGQLGIINRLHILLQTSLPRHSLFRSILTFRTLRDIISYLHEIWFSEPIDELHNQFPRGRKGASATDGIWNHLCSLRQSCKGY